MSKENMDINNRPDAQSLWSGIGGHFDSLGQILCEFIDNSISNFVGNNCVARTITLTIVDRKTHKHIKIEDTGTGIKDLDAAFTLGSKKGMESPLNEHGFGLKHALASANPKNDCWHVFTRTEEDRQKNQYKHISSPYIFDDFKAEIEQGWKGEFGQTGTIIEFDCSKEMFDTILKGLGGRSSFNRATEFLEEEIGFVYAGLIREGKVFFTILCIDENGIRTSKTVAAVEPDWLAPYMPGKGSMEYDLGNGIVTIEYCFGKINDRENGKKYYKHNMRSSGVEIRVNGRVMATNIFDKIWDIEKHNSYNNLLITFNIKSDNPERLPKTRTSKNGFREGDVRLDKLYEKIKAMMPTPQKDTKLATHEDDLFEELEKMKNTHMPDPKTVKRQQHVFTKLKEKIRIDLYISYANKVIIYEGKRQKTEPQDVYQLLMYWDGCVYDGVQPTDAFLIANEHPESVRVLIEEINTRMDQSGNKYNFKTKMWEDERLLI